MTKKQQAIECIRDIIADMEHSTAKSIEQLRKKIKILEEEDGECSSVH